MNRLRDLPVKLIYDHVKFNKNTGSKKFAILKIAIDDDIIKKKYDKLVTKHNYKVLNYDLVDSGFDIVLPKKTIFHGQDSTFVDFELKVEMLFCEIDKHYISNSPFLLIPRSSISKFPLILSNNIGIINSGYRGSITGAFRNYYSCSLDEDTSILQICHPSLCPIFTVIVNENELTNIETNIPAH
jgi:dUTP pyrophosphatase